MAETDRRWEDEVEEKGGLGGGNLDGDRGDKSGEMQWRRDRMMSDIDCEGKLK